MEFEPLHSASELDSPFNHGTGFGIAVAGAAVLSLVLLSWGFIALKLIGL